MIYVRLLPLFLGFAILSIFIILMLLLFCFQNTDLAKRCLFYMNITNETETTSSIVMMGRFISRKFDPKKDKDIEACSICLVEFSEKDTKPKAELNCSNKHIFHVECIDKWLDSGHNNCPNCRM